MDSIYFTKATAMYIQSTSLGLFGTQRTELQFKNHVVEQFSGQNYLLSIKYTRQDFNYRRLCLFCSYIQYVIRSTKSTFYIDAINFQTEAQVYGVRRHQITLLPISWCLVPRETQRRVSFEKKTALFLNTELQKGIDIEKLVQYPSNKCHQR